jgi:osmotically inducible protein OsmC
MNTAKMSEESTTTQIEPKVMYTAKAHTTGGRDGGASRTSDGRLAVQFSVPGKPGTGTNPEQMLAAGWSGCFLSALRFVAAERKVRFPTDAAIDAEVDLCAGSEGYFLQTRLNVRLPGVEHDLAQALVEAAHQTCPYSKATRGNIDVTLNVD